MSETNIAEKIERCPPALQAIIQEFREVTPRERLEILLEYSDDLPDLPERLQASRDAMEQIHECQEGATPEAIQATPEDVYMLLGLHEAIMPQRLRGLRAVIVYIKRQVQRLYQTTA